MEITKQNRTRNVKEYEYGQIEGFDLSYLDMPVKAEFCYNNANELIYENYDNLISFIEKNLIPYHIIKKDNIDSNKNFYYIRLKDILSFKFSEKEVTFLINYLGKKDIYVIGDSHTLEGEFSNYICNRIQVNNISKNLSLKDYSEEEEKRLFEEYSKNPSLELKQKIVLYNSGLVFTQCGIYSKIFNIDFNELYSYGVIGLLKAIPKFDISLGNKFSSFALYFIKAEILNGIKVLQDCPVKDGSKNYGFIKALKEFEQNQNEKIINDITIVDDFIDYLIKENVIKEKDKSLIINWSNAINYLSLQENSVYDYGDITSKVNLKIDVLKIIDTLDDRTKEILKMRFGISPYQKSYTLESIGNLYNISSEYVRKIEKKGLKKLKSKNNEKILADYY